MAAQGLIMEAMTLTVIVGAAYDGNTPSFSAGVSFMGIAKEVHLNETVEKTDVHGAGSASKLHRFHSQDGTLRLVSFVPATDYAYWPDTNTSPIGHYIQVVTKTNSALSSSKTWTGVVTNWKWDTSQGQPQMEEIEISLTPAIDT